MTVEIKVLRDGDERLLARVEPGLFDDPVLPAALTAFLRNPSHHLVAAFDKGAMVGFISGVHYVHPDKADPEFWINEVSVAPSHQRHGVGAAMLDAVIALARSLDCVEAWVLAERGNTAAMALYASRSRGSKPTDAVMFTFDLDEDGERG